MAKYTLPLPIYAELDQVFFSCASALTLPTLFTVSVADVVNT